MVERRVDACSTNVENGDGVHGVSSGRTTGRVASVEGARDAGVGVKPGTGKAVSAGGATRQRLVAAPAANGNERREQRREME